MVARQAVKNPKHKSHLVNVTMVSNIDSPGLTKHTEMFFKITFQEMNAKLVKTENIYGTAMMAIPKQTGPRPGKYRACQSAHRQIHMTKREKRSIVL